MRARRSALPRESAQGLARDAGRPGASSGVAEPRIDATTNLAFEEPWRVPPKFPLSTALLASAASVPRPAQGHCAACRPRSCRHCCRPLASSSASKSAVVAAAPLPPPSPAPGRLGRAWAWHGRTPLWLSPSAAAPRRGRSTSYLFMYPPRPAVQFRRRAARRHGTGGRRRTHLPPTPDPGERAAAAAGQARAKRAWRRRRALRAWRATAKR